MRARDEGERDQVQFVGDEFHGEASHYNSAHAQLVLLRHGESDWNRENRFTGWTDVDLSAKGVEEARAAGPPAARPRAGPSTSPSPRCSSAPSARSASRWRSSTSSGSRSRKDWRLNERHYGALQGLNKAETAAKFGEAQVLAWRRSYDTPPPALDAGRPARARAATRATPGVAGSSSR